MSKGSEPAFPIGEIGEPAFRGLTKLELLSGMAMQGLLSNENNRRNAGEVAEYAVSHARALLDRLRITGQ